MVMLLLSIITAGRIQKKSKTSNLRNPWLIHTLFVLPLNTSVEQVVVADDRDVQVSIGVAAGAAWLTLDCVIAAFVDPLTAEKGHMVSVATPLVSMGERACWERRWQWEWVTTASVAKKESTEEEEPAEQQAEEPEGTATEEKGSLTLPKEAGTWSRLPCQWEGTDVLYIPVPSDAPSEEEGDAVKEEETPTAAAAAASFAVVLSNHLSLPGQYTPSSSKMVLRKLSDQVCRKRFFREFFSSVLSLRMGYCFLTTTVSCCCSSCFQSETLIRCSTNTYVSVELEMNNPDPKSRMYEIISDTPAGCT